MNDICCLHRPRNIFTNSGDLTTPHLENEAWSKELPIWSTCQRQIILTDLVTAEKHKLFSHANSTAHIDTVYTGSDAFQFLLEVVSGLHSKLIGETEILGQFKIFLTTLEKDHSAFYKMHLGFFQNILTDTKKVRDLHLKNLGAQSYGSLVRRSLKDEEKIVVFGGGQLASEILPWLEKKTKVQVVVRNPEKAEAYLHQNVKSPTNFEILSFESWSADHINSGDAWVMAAPLSNDEFLKHLAHANGVRRIIDLRGEDELRAINKHGLIEYMSFPDVVAQIENFNSHVKTKTAAALADIKQRTEKFRAFAIYRPLGWDDLWN